MERQHWVCMDCGKNTFESGEYFHLKDSLWRRINPLIVGMRCLQCAEDRLGRLLCRSDFSTAPINATHAERCSALAERLARKKSDPLVPQLPQRKRKKVQSSLGQMSATLLKYRGKNGHVSSAALRRFMAEQLATRPLALQRSRTI